MEKLDDSSQGVVDMPKWLVEVLSEGALKAIEKKETDPGDNVAIPQVATSKVLCHFYLFFCGVVLSY